MEFGEFHVFSVFGFRGENHMDPRATQNIRFPTGPRRGPRESSAAFPGVAPSSGLLTDDRGHPPRPSRGWPRAADFSLMVEEILRGLPGVGPEQRTVH